MNVQIHAQRSRGLGREKDSGYAEIDPYLHSRITKDTNSYEGNFGVTASLLVLLQMLDEEPQVFGHDQTTLVNHSHTVRRILVSDIVIIGRKAIVHTNQTNVGMYEDLLGEPPLT